MGFLSRTKKYRVSDMKENEKKRTDEENEDEDDSRNKQVFQEVTYGWLVVIACGYCFGINIGYINVYSLLYNKFVVVYNSTENNVVYAAWIGSTANGVQYFFCFLSSLLVDMSGSRPIAIIGGLLSCVGLLSSAFVKDMKMYFLTYSIIHGIGQSLLITSFLAILPHYFDKRIGLANGLMNFIGCIITVSLPFAIQESLDSLGLQKTFYILAGLCFGTVLAAFSFRPRLPVTEHETFSQRLKAGMGLRVFRSKRFLIWIMGSFIGFFGYLIPIVTMSHLSSIKFPSKSAAIVSAVLGGSSGASGIIFGKIADHVKATPVYFLIVSFFLAGIIQCIVPSLHNFIAFCIFLGLYGIVDGIFLSFIVPISLEVSRSPKLTNQSTGYFFLAISIPSIVGPTLAGFIFEKTGGYDIAYYSGGAFALFAALVFLIVYPDTLFCQIIARRRVLETVTCTDMKQKDSLNPANSIDLKNINTINIRKY